MQFAIKWVRSFPHCHQSNKSNKKVRRMNLTYYRWYYIIQLLDILLYTYLLWNLPPISPSVSHILFFSRSRALCLSLSLSLLFSRIWLINHIFGSLFVPYTLFTVDFSHSHSLCSLKIEFLIANSLLFVRLSLFYALIFTANQICSSFMSELWSLCYLDCKQWINMGRHIL